MNKRILRKIFWATALVLLLSVVVCFFVIYGITYFSKHETISKNMTVYNERIAGAEDFEQLNEALGAGEGLMYIGVLSSEGNLITSNSELSGENVPVKDAEFTAKVREKGSLHRLEKMYKDGETMLIVYVSIENAALDEGGYLVVAYGMDMNFNDLYFWLAVGGCIAAWVIIAAATYAIFTNYIKDEVMPLEKIQIMLENFNKGNYKPINYEAKYKEIDIIVDNINKAAKKLSDTMSDLRYEQNKTKFVIENVAQGIIALNEQNKILISNDVVADIFDTRANIVGVPIDYLIKDEKVLAEVAEAVERGSNAMAGEIMVGEKCYRVDCRIVGEEILDEFKDIKYFLLITDVTSEAVLAKMRSEFFFNASHELKSPLTSIMGFSELMMDPDLSAENRAKCVEDIHESSKRMATLIEKMITLGKLDSAQYAEKTSEEVDLRAIGDDVVKRMEIIADSINVKMTCEGEAKITGDPNQMSILLSNLVSNAIKYNKENGIVRLSFSEDEKEARVCVEDSGIGIAKKDIPRICDRFYRVNSAHSKTSLDSNGLGLSIVKQIVDDCGAKLRIESTVGKGSKFTIIFKR